VLSIAINNVHSGLKEKYDNDIFIYSDPRLQFLDKLTKSFIKENVKNDDDLLNKIVDVVLGICKEDIYYRARLFLLLNSYLDKNIKFELTEEEKRICDK